MKILKLAVVNLEKGSPTKAQAVQKMKNSLSTYKGLGAKAVILIHGYGSTGVGGGIRIAVKEALAESSMRGIVRFFFGGENWSEYKREAVAVCKQLKEYERTIDRNKGLTVVILK